MEQFRRAGLLIALLSAAAGCREPTGPTDDAVAVGRQVSIDFSSYGSGKEFESDFFRVEGIVFPAEACGPAGCTPWFIGFIQGDDALVGDARFGPVTATFTNAIVDLSLLVAPTGQGTATYVLRAYTASGTLVRTRSVTVTQDSGDPATTGFGYFSIGLTSLPASVKRFTLENVFVRSSFPQIEQISYGVSSISYTR